MSKSILKNEEKFKKPHGQISMILHKGGVYDIKTGSIKNGEIISQKNIDNLIVDKASVLMAARMAPGAITGSTAAALQGDFLDHGLQYLAIGVGILKDPSKPYDKVTNPVDTTNWDLQDPNQELLTDIKLQGELFRKPFTSWCFVNPDGSESQTKTNVLKLVTTFVENEAIGPLTEMGLFGGDAQDWNNGTGKDTGHMFNYKTYSVWNKPSDARLSISWVITF